MSVRLILYGGLHYEFFNKTKIDTILIYSMSLTHVREIDRREAREIRQGRQPRRGERRERRERM